MPNVEKGVKLGALLDDARQTVREEVYLDPAHTYPDHAVVHIVGTLCNYQLIVVYSNSDTNQPVTVKLVDLRNNIEISLSHEETIVTVAAGKLQINKPVYPDGDRFESDDDDPVVDGPAFLETISLEAGGITDDGLDEYGA